MEKQRTGCWSPEARDEGEWVGRCKPRLYDEVLGCPGDHSWQFCVVHFEVAERVGFTNSPWQEK